MVFIQPGHKMIAMNQARIDQALKPGFFAAPKIINQDQILEALPVQAGHQIGSNESTSTGYNYHCPKLSLCIFAPLMILVTRKAHFNAAHKLWNPNWDEARNEEVFGKCAHKNWHGHNFELWVTIAGEVDPDTGFVLDLKVLKRLIQDKVIEPLDHSNINMDVPFMQGRLASTENLAIAIWDQLYEDLLNPRYRLHCIRLAETHQNSVTYYGPQPKTLLQP